MGRKMRVKEVNIMSIYHCQSKTASIFVKTMNIIVLTITILVKTMILIVEAIIGLLIIRWLTGFLKQGGAVVKVYLCVTLFPYGRSHQPRAQFHQVKLRFPTPPFRGVPQPSEQCVRHR